MVSEGGRRDVVPVVVGADTPVSVILLPMFILMEERETLRLSPPVNSAPELLARHAHDRDGLEHPDPAGGSFLVWRNQPKRPLFGSEHRPVHRVRHKHLRLEYPGIQFRQ